jgi:glycosyltransferase involved in cell wall biosynthesis
VLNQVQNPCTNIAPPELPTEQSSRPKVLLVANTGWYLYNFRLPLARSLRDCGLEVVLVTPRDAYVTRMEAEGFRWVELPLNRKSLNPFGEILALSRLVRIYQRESPAACHHFTVKCVIYGTIAAKLAGVRGVLNAVTGLGHVFLGERLSNRILRPFVRFLYRRVLTARRVQVVLQNIDDFDDFKKRNLILPEKTTIIRGSGINLTRFRPRPGPLDGNPAPTILLASRLIREKGVVEFVEAARILKSKGLEATFTLAGSPDSGNPSALSRAELEAWRQEGVIDYLGHIEQMEPVLAACDIVVLPSYREGTPRILLEAAAMGKPIVTTDVPGCREVVQDNVNGFLVPARDPIALAAALEKLLLQPELRKSFGNAGLELVKDFCEKNVIAATVDVYRKAGISMLPVGTR